MGRILVTGPTVNVGFEVIRPLVMLDHSHQIVAGVRCIEKPKLFTEDFPDLIVS